LHYPLAATTFWKGAHREYWRDGWQQKLLDLDGSMGGGVDGPAACAGKLKDFRAPLRDDSFPAKVAAVFVNVDGELVESRKPGPECFPINAL
jgi:hypothetical protein